MVLSIPHVHQPGWAPLLGNDCNFYLLFMFVIVLLFVFHPPTSPLILFIMRFLIGLRSILLKTFSKLYFDDWLVVS